MMNRAAMAIGVIFSTMTGTLCPAETVPFEPRAWDVEAEAHRYEEYRGRQALFLDRGVAVAKGKSLENGVIEFDINLADARGFSGVLWRMLDGENHEEFYLRHHLSGQPDACQYTPVFNGLRGWQLYSGPGFSSPVVFKAGRWTHVKLVILGNRADVYVDSDTPVLHVHDLKRSPARGAVALKSSLAPAWYANFRYQARDDVDIVGSNQGQPSAPPGSFLRWEVSEPFPHTRIENTFDLNEGSTGADDSSLEWRPVEAEPTGVVNLARVSRMTVDNDTVFARIRLDSDRDRSRVMNFGFSDRVSIYLNGRLLYSGSDPFQSRDYRFLGTVGLFDAVVLELEAGSNEVLFAVTEVFGGWGVAAQIEDQGGIRAP